MLNIKLNLTSGAFIKATSPDYIKPGREGNECGAECPSHPHYRCTREKGHENRKGNGVGADKDDHAAHGWVGSRRFLGMFARWSESLVEVGAEVEAPVIANAEQPIEPATVTDPEPDNGN